MDELEKVSFIINIEDDANMDEVIEELNKLSEDMAFNPRRFEGLGIQMLTGYADQNTYESVFDAKVEYRTWTYNNINTGPQTISDWVEIEKAKVPESLQEKVNRIDLNRKMYLTD